MAETDIFFWIITAVVICLIGFSKGGLGGAGGTLATPLMVLVMPADVAVGLLLPILMMADVFAVIWHWKKWDNRLIILLLPGAVLGVIFGTFFLSSISADALRWGIAIIALLFVAYRLLESRIVGSIQYESKSWHGWLAGTVAGFSSTLAHTGGPPIAIYLLMQNINPRVYVATSALFFTALNWIKVPSYFFAGLFDFQLLWKIAWLLPLLPISVWLGRWASTRIDKVMFDRVILVLLALSAVLLLIK